MDTLKKLVRDNERLTRRSSRLLSLISFTFFLSIVLFNDDVRSQLDFRFILYGLVVAALLFAWLKERSGGLVAMFLSLFLGAVVLVNAVFQNDLPLSSTLIGLTLLLLPNFLIGMMFYMLGKLST